jgi:hypothetical protein
VLVLDDTRPEELLKARVGETQSESEVEGVVYNTSSLNETCRLEKHAQAEYGVGLYATVTVEIEVLAQGNRRARKIEGRTIIYIGGFRSLGQNNTGSTTTMPQDYVVEIKKTKQLARKPLPIKPNPQAQPGTMETAKRLPPSPSLNYTSAFQHSASLDVIEPLPRSPSLNLASVVQRPASYRGASICGTQTMLSERGVSMDSTSDDILRDLNEEISRVYEDWKRGARYASSHSIGQAALVSSTRLKEEVSSPCGKDARKKNQERGEELCGPRPLSAHGKDNQPDKHRAYDSAHKYVSSRASYHRSEDISTKGKTRPKPIFQRIAHGGTDKILPDLPEHVARVAGIAEANMRPMV